MKPNCITSEDFELADQLVEAALRLVTPLRMREAFDEEAFAETKRLLTECASAWDELAVVPKQAAEAFIALEADMYAFAANYPDEEAKRIREAVYKLSDIIIDCIALPEELRRRI